MHHQPLDAAASLCKYTFPKPVATAASCHVASLEQKAEYKKCTRPKGTIVFRSKTTLVTPYSPFLVHLFSKIYPTSWLGTLFCYYYCFPCLFSLIRYTYRTHTWRDSDWCGVCHIFWYILIHRDSFKTSHSLRIFSCCFYIDNNINQSDDYLIILFDLRPVLSRE